MPERFAKAPSGSDHLKPRLPAGAFFMRGPCRGTHGCTFAEWLSRRDDDPRQRRRDVSKTHDVSKAHDVLKWTPQTALKEGLARTIAHFEELLRDEAIRPFIVHEQGARA
jgi:hypothetical protein